MIGERPPSDGDLVPCCRSRLSLGVCRRWAKEDYVRFWRWQLFLLLQSRSGTFWSIIYTPWTRSECRSEIEDWRTHERVGKEKVTMFTPIETSVGALLLHQATSNLLYQSGSILGASEIMRQLFTDPTKETLAFFVGMAASVLPLRTLAPQLVTSFPTATMTLQAGLFTAAVGALVGWGTKVSAHLRRPGSTRANDR